MSESLSKKATAEKADAPVTKKRSTYKKETSSISQNGATMTVLVIDGFPKPNFLQPAMAMSQEVGASQKIPSRSKLLGVMILFWEKCPEICMTR